MIDLKNKTAVITGASGGIGKAIASKLAGKKLKICLVGRNTDKLERQKQLLVEKTADVQVFKADFTKSKDIEEFPKRIIQRFGVIDILIHNAGFLSMEPIEKSTIDNLELHYKINYLAPFLITQAFLPVLIKTSGQIVFLNTSATQKPVLQLAQYTSSKLALKGFADILREEINQYGVRVTNIFPGQTATIMQKKIYDKRKKNYTPERMIQPDDIADVIVHTLMLSRTAEITDIYIRPLQKPG